jgi:hypothetical protein
MEILIPLLGISAGIIIPLAVFYWQYLETKNKNGTIIEISKNIDDPSKLEDMLSMLDERKKEPIDYRRSGVVTLFTGVGLFLMGVFFLMGAFSFFGPVLKGVGALVAAIGLGQIIAGYLYPNTSEELTNAVEEFEKK